MSYIKEPPILIGDPPILIRGKKKSATLFLSSGARMIFDEDGKLVRGYDKDGKIKIYNEAKGGDNMSPTFNI